MSVASVDSSQSEDSGQCLCGLDSTEGSQHDESLGLQIECDICHVWYHVRCVGLGPIGAQAIDKFHCPRCETMCGPSLVKKRTNTHRHDFTDPNAHLNATQVGTRDFIVQLNGRAFPDALENAVVVEVSGHQLTLPYLNQSGFRSPVLVDDPDGIGLTLPDPDLSLQDIEALVGRDAKVEVIDVLTQDTRIMSVGEFRAAFELSDEEREANHMVLNCLSLEVSDTPLGDLLEPPAVARKLCWVNNVWPQSGELERPPRVQKYCILSMKNSYTDFHTDFGGTSVWYHVLSGRKIFYLIQPSSNNLSLYERWQRLSSQSETFLADTVDQCYQLTLTQGQTLFIPTGWIHAVYTPEDSIVFGGNFLHSLNIQLQLKVFEIEDRLSTPNKFRFPSFEVVNWLAAQKLKNDLSDLNSETILCPSHLLGGIKALYQTLRTWLQDLDNRPCPSSINAHVLVRELGKEVRMAERIANKCDPPKPARESTRKKQKKELNEDFIDISHGNAFLFMAGRAASRKKSPTKKSPNQLLHQGYSTSSQTNTSVIHEVDAEAIKKQPLKKRPVPSQSKRPASSSSSSRKATKSEPTIKLKLPMPAEGLGLSASYDLTDRSAVRSIMAGSRRNIKELNSALDDALSGFDDVDNFEGERAALGHGSRIMMNDDDNPLKSLKLKLSVNKSLAANTMLGRARRGLGAADDLKMTNVHQDDDYVYPSLELSDDEMGIGPSMPASKDEAWSPRVRVKHLANQHERRPVRDGAKKVTAVEMGLKLAAERAAERRHRPKLSAGKKAKPLEAAIKAAVPASSSSQQQLQPQSRSLLAPTVVGQKKAKKGMVTAKQRIAKTLGLKF